MKKLHASLLLAGFCACLPHEQPAATFTLNVAPLPQGISTPCSAAPGGISEFTTEVDSLQLSVSGPGMKRMTRTYSVRDEMLMEKIPVGEGRVVSVTGYKGPLPLWRGATRDITIEDGVTTDVSMLLSRVSDLTCARGGMQEARSFHTATPLKDGRVLIVGGVTQESDATTCMPAGGVCRNLVATNTADIFDPATGRFEPAGQMANARAFHTAVALGDGRVVIVGGVSSAQLNTLASFPIVPGEQAGVRDIEVFDPETGAFSVIGQEPEAGIGGRTFAAGLTLDDGRALITGGGTPSLVMAGDPNRASATNTSILCDGSGGGVVCTVGSSMVERRLGHVLVQVNERDGTRQVMAFGGVVDVGTQTGLDDNGSPVTVTRQTPEFFDGLQWIRPTDRPAYVNGSDANTNVFFATAIRVEGVPGPLIVGGLTRDPAETGMDFLPPAKAVTLYDEAYHWMAVGVEGSPPFELNVPRFLASAAPFGDGTKWIVTGGFENLTGMMPSWSMEFFDGRAETLGFRQITVGGVPRTMRQRRGGVTASPLPNGIAVLLAGGSSPDSGTGSTTVLDTAEIFTDNAEPAP